MPQPHQHNMAAIRRAVYETIEQGPVGNRASLLFDRLIVVLLVVNLAAVILESVPRYVERYHISFEIIEYVSLVAFTIDYGLRLWVAPEHAPFRHMSPMRARLGYALSAAGLIDLLTVIPFWFAFLLPGDFRAVLALRMFRFLKITRYSPAMRSLLDVLYSERRALFGCIVILFGTTLMTASVMYLVEGHIQPDKLGTIPDAMWWAIVTLGTIGYGDVVPVTIAGKAVAALTIFLGLVMIALPVGIIANAFSEEIHRREFVVTWSMVARVPLFSELNAGEIADIMRLLRAQQVEPGEIVVRRGEPGHSMYFIAAGEIQIDLPHHQVRLGAGHFFGEVAVLRRTRRSANVTAVTRTSLLVLDAHDLHALMDRDPRIARRLREVARDRIKREVVAKGDLVTEEIEERKPRRRR